MTGQSVMAEQDNGVYRRLSADMRRGLKDIYQQISTASNDTAIDGRKTDALFTEASDQLDEVVKATESAAMSIMEIVERHFEQQAESAAIIARIKAGDASAADIDKLAAINDSLGADLNSVLTTLSFQDITGQHIKKVVAALNAIEDSVVQLYISSGLIMEGAERDPAKDSDTLQAEAQKAVDDFRDNRKAGSELKGPDKDGISQNAIDDMLAQLGL